MKVSIQRRITGRSEPRGFERALDDEGFAHKKVEIPVRPHGRRGIACCRLRALEHEDRAHCGRADA